MQQPLEALTAGKVDICVAALPSVLQAQLDGHTVKILCNFYQKGSAVVTAATKGIDAIEKLAGKTVGYTDGTTEYAQLRADLYNRQMDANAITWKEMAPLQLNAALKAGTIDAYCGDAALAGTAFMQGYGKILAYPYADDLGYGNLVLVTTEAKIQEKRDWLQEMVNTNYQVMEMAAPLEDFACPRRRSLASIHREYSRTDNYQWVWDMEEEYVMFIPESLQLPCPNGVFQSIPD